MPENRYIMCEDDIPIVIPKRIMVFAGHPDDELVSVGGTILKYQALGSEITIVVATKGAGGYAKEENKGKVFERRESELKHVTDELKWDLIELGYSDLSVDREIISRITNLIRDRRPQIIFIPHYTDFHRVHRHLSLITREAIYHCSTGKAYGGYGRTWTPLGVYYYESPSCKFQYIDGSVFIVTNIDNYWEQKKNIFNQVYTSQKEVLEMVLEWAEDTAILRGNEIGAKFGECFIPEVTYTPLRIVLV